MPVATAGFINPSTALAVAPSPPAVQFVNTNLSLWKETLYAGFQVLHVVGELQNNDPARNAQNIMVDCQLSNQGTALNVEARDSAEVEVLQPGERSPFDVLFFNPPAADAASCVISDAASPLQPNHNFLAQITSVTTGSDGFQHVKGTVQNLNAVTVANARLLFTFYQNATDNPLRTIAEDRLFVNDANAMAPGSTSAFELLRAQPAWDGVASALLVEAPVPGVGFSPASIALTQVITRSTAPQVISLTNIGTGDLHIGLISKGGDHPGDWSETDTCAGSTVASTASCTISVVFTPASTGDRSASLTVADDANRNPQVFTLTGTGIDPHAVASPTPLNFPPQPLGTTSERLLTVTNTGVGDLHLTSVTSGGPNRDDFIVDASADGCSGATVAQSTACTVGIQFSPTAVGNRTATLTIADNALNSPQLVTVNGTGITATVSFNSADGTYAFGNQLYQTTAQQTITMTNTSQSVVNVAAVTAGGSNPGDFPVLSDGCSGQRIAAQGTCSVTVGFIPQATGPRSASLSFADNAPNSPQMVTLTGNGTLGGQYLPVAPNRIYDTRTSGIGPLGPGEERPVQVTGSQVPPGAVAVVLNVTVTNTTRASYLTVFPTGISRPTASSLNWTARQTVPNLVEVPLGSGGQVSFFNAYGNTDLILDLQGYVNPAAATPGGAGFFNPLPPLRVLDTRSAGVGVTAAGKVGAQGSIDVQLTGRGNVPVSGVSAVVLNVTVTNPSAPSYLTVFPTGGAVPIVSNLNFSAGQTVPNRVVVMVGTGGKVTFFNAAGTVDVVADIGGWFTDSSNALATGAGFVGVTPNRILDTRSGAVPLRPGETRSLMVTSGSVPLMTSPTPPRAVVLNVTVTNPTSPSYLTVFPDGTPPLSSDLNFVSGQTVPNMVVVKVASDGTIKIFNATGSVDVVVDLVGWYG
ncbi:MAG TPA: choice-of-anchor D domain-containing protein [Candidatus Dormibacteraeota bacterium]|nr:choice-of-anchor D domain-containing protein [Candidatus Dormibacteraeota bacterium]